MDPNSQNPNPQTPTFPQVAIPNNPGETKDQIKSIKAKGQPRDYHGRFSAKVEGAKLPPISVTTNSTQSVNTSNPPDLVNFKITNPLVYIKYWWKRIMANEGLELKFKARPLTVFGVALIAFSLAFGLGGVVLPVAFPWLKVNSNQAVSSPTSQPVEWKDTALKGILKKTTTTPARFFLLTSSDETVTLQIPEGINLTPLTGKRILAVGSYNQKQKLLVVLDVQDLEVLPATPIPIPTSTLAPTLIPTPTPLPSPSAESLSPTESPTPLPN